MMGFGQKGYAQEQVPAELRDKVRRRNTPPVPVFSSWHRLSCLPRTFVCVRLGVEVHRELNLFIVDKT